MATSTDQTRLDAFSATERPRDSDPPDRSVLVGRIAAGVGELLMVALLSLLAPLIVAVDVGVTRRGVTESSLTELTQEGLLFVTASIFLYAAWRDPRARGLHVLAAGFFGSMVARELDSVFDHVWQGFWLWPALGLAVGAMAYVATAERDTVLWPMADIIGTRPYFYLGFGLVVVLLFSRVFGSGELLWEHVMGAGYQHAFKTTVQEGLELFGCVFIASGAGLLLWYRQRRACQSSSAVATEK